MLYFMDVYIICIRPSLDGQDIPTENQAMLGYACKLIYG